MSKKLKKCILILLAVALLAVGVVLIGFYAYNHADHAKNLEETEIAAYNTAITAAARKAGSIRDDEFILIDTISKEVGGNTNISIRVYKLPDGAKQADYMGLRVSDLPEDFGPEFMARGTARLIDDSMDRIVVTVNYVR